MRYLYQNKYWPINEEYNLDKLLYLMIDRADKIVLNGYIWFNNKKQYHRDYDLPSYIWWYNNNGVYELNWYVNNKRHKNNNKPAYINGFNGIKKYWTNGKFIKTEKPK